MSKRPCLPEDLPVLLQPLLGTTVSRAWSSTGTYLFLELGRLTPTSCRVGDEERVFAAGEASVQFEWTWRVERAGQVLFGSSTGNRARSAAIASLEGARLDVVEMVGEVPELWVGLDDGRVLATMSTVEGDPRWSIRLPAGRYLYPHEGRILLDTCGDGFEANESVAGDARREIVDAGRVADRWEARFEGHPAQTCWECQSRIFLDAPGPLLDFLVCTSSESPFDGHVVHRAHGCLAFRPFS